MPQVEPDIETFARIKVVGVGGAGGAAINRMVDAGVSGVDFIAINTDAQALHNSKAHRKVHIGDSTTRGLGAGADPELGFRSAQESVDEIKEALKDADMTFVTFGAGGGTGSGAGPVVAQLAHDSGSLVVGFATKPFAFEGDKRRRNADTAVDKLRRNVDTLITIPNDRLLQTIDRRTPLLEAFKVADDVLRQGVQGISDLITVHGLVNLDFADVKTVMANAGSALMGIGRASGENRAIDAAQQAISSPLLEVSIDGARGILFNVIGGNDMSMHEINTVAETITAAADPEANIIFGATINPDLEGEVIVTVVATGFDDAYFASRNAKAAELVRKSQDKAVPQVDEETISGIDMNLQKEDQDLHDFHKDDVPNIWSLGDEDNGSMLDSDEDELDKPSFLRRFKRRTRKEDEEDDAGEASPPDRADEPAEEDGNSEDADEDPAEDEKPKSKKK
jgi:cell division protein FtsZ